MKSLAQSVLLNNAIVSFLMPRTYALGRQWTRGHRSYMEPRPRGLGLLRQPRSHSSAVSPVMFGIYHKSDWQVALWKKAFHLKINEQLFFPRNNIPYMKNEHDSQTKPSKRLEIVLFPGKLNRGSTNLHNIVFNRIFNRLSDNFWPWDSL